MPSEQSKGNKATEIALKSAVNDLTKFMVDRRKHEVRVFRDLSEADQQLEIERTRSAAFDAVRQLNELFASHGYQRVGVTLPGLLAVKDELVTFKGVAVKDDLELIAYKGPAILTLTSMSAFGHGSMPKPDKDQPDMPLEEPEDIREARERREELEREAFEQSEAQRKEGEAALRRMHVEEARKKGFDAFELDADCVVPEEYAGDEEAATAYREAWAAAGEQAAKFKGSKKGGKKPPKPDEDQAA